MIGGILDKVTGFLDQRVIFTSLLPSIAFWATVAALVGSQAGWSRTRNWWGHLGTGTSVLVTVIALAILVLFALVLSAHEGRLLSLYEGYWGRRGIGARLARRAANRHGKRVERLNKQIAELDRKIDQLADENSEKREKTRQVNALFEYLYRNYPRDPADAVPTCLGNILKAAERYPADDGRYGMDAVFYWPRLIAVVPTAARADLSDARASLAMLLNVCTLSLLLAAGTLVTLTAAVVHPAAAFWGTAAGATLVAFLTYRSALGPATVYAELVRATFDLYKGDLLAQLKFALPGSLEEERALWANLAEQIYRGAANLPGVLDTARTRATSPAVPASAMVDQPGRGARDTRTVPRTADHAAIAAASSPEPGGPEKGHNSGPSTAPTVEE